MLSHNWHMQIIVHENQTNKQKLIKIKDNQVQQTLLKATRKTKAERTATAVTFSLLPLYALFYGLTDSLHMLKEILAKVYPTPRSICFKCMTCEAAIFGGDQNFNFSTVNLTCVNSNNSGSTAYSGYTADCYDVYSLSPPRSTAIHTC